MYIWARAHRPRISHPFSLFLSLAPGDKSPLVVFCPSFAFSSFSPRASRFSIASSSSSSSAASLFLLFFCVSYSSYTCDYTYRAGELTCSESSLPLSLSFFPCGVARFAAPLCAVLSLSTSRARACLVPL